MTARVRPKACARNSPTHPSLVLEDAACDAGRERARRLAAVHAFHPAEPASAARHRHAFVQGLAGDGWGRVRFEHLDHHLRQFGACRRARGR